MLKISCAIGGAAGSAFLVYMDVDQSVGDLKDAIKKKNVATITCDAKDIKFFLAKKKDGNWLTENKVLRGESDTDGRPYLRVARAELALAGLSEDEVRVQEQIQRLIDFERRDCRTDDVALYALILKHAKAQHRFFSQSKDSAATFKEKSGAAATPATATTPKQAYLKSAKTSSGKQNKGCLFYKGPHWLRECPTATEQQRRAALERFQEAKQRRVDSIRLKAAGPGRARYMATLNGVLDVPYLPDTGADRSILPSGVPHALEAAAPPVTVRQLARPVPVILADGRTTNCMEEALLDLQLTTPPEEDEFPVGLELLNTAGIAVGDMPSIQREIIDMAVENRFPVEGRNELEALLNAYDEIWGVQASPGPPARVKPLHVTLPEGAVPVRCHGRPYLPLQRTFIRDYVSQLLERGLIRKNNASKWASPVVPVRKPGTEDQFRLTIDYRVVNSKTVPLAGQLPTQGEVLDAEVFSFMTPEEVFSPLRVTQDATDSALHCSA
ncbi:hypothetical protein PC110_g4422 [Phytophthora cactorum]|uniref:Crinkler effector protein N-terminal domain-containing protein n=2 Tax=Phytophthora cactorum TaxID=29920 RepID=A0A329SR41_9STRA|nr:hypothetical protein PC110_g4422 [Phytophthora cactorum]